MTDLLPLAVAGLAFVLLVWLTLARPTVTFVLFLLTGPLLELTHMTPAGPPAIYFAVHGVRPVDAVLLVLAAATTVRLVLAALRRWPWPAWLSVTALGLTAWLLYSVVRNMDRYRLSAPGEFRYLYLILAAPVAAAVLLERPDQRAAVARAALAVALPVTLASLPVIAAVTDWRPGTGQRLLPAALSLGLALGWLTLALGRRHLGLPRWTAAVSAAPVAFMVLVDSHRSVWLALLAAGLAAATVLGVGRVLRSRLTLPVTTVATLMLVAVVAGGVPLLPFLAERSLAFTRPEHDPTASWRQTQWRAALGEWSERPWRGDGFGGYWSGLAARGGADVVPHNLYVQTLAKTGAVGLALLLATVVAIIAALATRLRARPPLAPGACLDDVLAFVGLLALVAALAYGVAYALEPFGLLFTGLGVAAAVHAPASRTVTEASWLHRGRALRLLQTDGSAAG